MVFERLIRVFENTLVCEKLSSSGCSPEDFLVLLSDVQKSDFQVGTAHNPRLGIPPENALPMLILTQERRKEKWI